MKVRSLSTCSVVVVVVANNVTRLESEVDKPNTKDAR
jgi:hypothetical protein